jgi:16S rRNA (cytosine967-C5)-methyltransferase
MSDPTREAAFDLLTAVCQRFVPLEDALDSLPPMAARDRAAAHRLAACVLRRMGTLDAVLEPLLKKEPPLPVRQVLRIGAAGLLLLGTAQHAGVATAVGLAKERGLAAFAGLVNAVLRRVASGSLALLDGLDPPRLDTPAWLWRSWGSDARAIATAHQREAPLDLTLAAGAAAPPGGDELPTGSWRYPPGTRVTELDGYESGSFWVQDAAAAMPAKLLAPLPGERVADLCAAPGGKTAQLASSGAVVTAVERDPARLGRLRDNLNRLRLGADLVLGDVEDWHPAERFDAALLDAPCSATGTIRRHPDIPYLKRPRDIASLAATQANLLGAAIRLVRPGGRVIYSVCSLQPEEGAAIASRPPPGLEPDPFLPAELACLPEALTPEGWMRTHPGLWADKGGMDGFFAARFRRI